VRKNILRKSIGSVCLIIVVAALTVVAACAPAAKPGTTKPIELTVTHFHPTAGAFHGMMVPWAEMVEEASDGRLKITVHPAGTFFAPPDTYQGVIDGLADIALGFYGFTPGRFPGVEVIDLPSAPWTTDGPIASVVAQKLWDKGYLTEWFEDVHVLWLFANVNPGKLNFTKPVRTLDEFKGLNIRVGSALHGKFVEALGANTALMSTADVYVGLEKGIIDACLFPYEAVVAFKYYEVAKYTVTENTVVSTFFVVMNKEKFESLPRDLQKVIENHSGMFGTEFCADAWAPYEPAAIETLKAAGHEFIDLGPQDKARWQAAAESIWGFWVADVTKRGADGQKILDAAIKFAEEYK
jgi:TRAP-type C4-dicarboxylate transport system substrate-binding protein